MEDKVGGLVHKLQLQTLIASLNGQTESLRILIWLALSGSPSLRDAVLLRLASVDWTTGLITYRRVASGSHIQFGALPPLLELLKLRKERFGPGAIYALPELIFTAAQLRNPAYNSFTWVTVPEPIVVRATAIAGNAVDEFFSSCGIRATDLPFRSFRRQNISFWASIGILLEACMRKDDSWNERHDRYYTLAEIDILRARELTWQYLEAIR
jgi:hypothetical protein